MDEMPMVPGSLRNGEQGLNKEECNECKEGMMAGNYTELHSTELYNMTKNMDKPGIQRNSEPPNRCYVWCHHSFCLGAEAEIVNLEMSNVDL